MRFNSSPSPRSAAVSYSGLYVPTATTGNKINLKQACLVSGETGCGKSTQVPQFLLDDQSIGPSSKIVCTQPRRISAIAVAERIAEERGEKIGGKVCAVSFAEEK